MTNLEQMVLFVLDEAPCLLTCPQIQQRLREKGVQIKISQLYNLLAILQKERKIRVYQRGRIRLFSKSE